VVSALKSGAGDGNRTRVRSLGSSYSAIELRPLALNLVDCTSLSKSRAQRVFFLIFQNWQKPFFLGDLQYVRVVANFVSLFHPAN
jgi:hypothetical protein